MVCRYTCHSLAIKWDLTASAKVSGSSKFTVYRMTKISKYGQYLEPKAQPHVRLYLIAKICTFKCCPSAVVRHFT